MNRVPTATGRGARNRENPRVAPITVDDLVHAIYVALNNPTPLTRKRVWHRWIVLANAANKLCEFLACSSGRPAKRTRRLTPAELSKARKRTRIHQLVYIESRFREYLKRRRFSNGYITSLQTQRRHLLQWAKHLGWSHLSQALEEEWAPLKVAVPRIFGCRGMIKDAIAHKRHIRDYSLADHNRWAKGRAQDYALRTLSAFLAAIRKAGLEKSFRSLDTMPRRLPPLRLPPELVRGKLGRELKKLFAERRAEAKRSGIELHDPTEAWRMRQFEMLCAFAADILHIRPLISLKQVLKRHVFRSYARVLFRDRHVSRATIASRFSALSLTLRQHPRYWKQGFRWILEIVEKTLPEVPESTILDRREMRLARYDDVLTMIKKLRHDRLTKKFESEEERGWFIHDSLCFFLLAVAVWPPLSVRQCRFEGENGNLYEAPISKDDMPLDLPPSARRQKKRNPHVKLWQHKFEAKETRLRHYVHAILLHLLVPVLKEYKHYRPLLVGRDDPGTLALGRQRGTLSSSGLRRLIGDLTYDYMGRRIWPSSFQAIFGWDYITHNPDKYTQLASILGWEVISVMERFGNLKKRRPF